MDRARFDLFYLCFFGFVFACWESGSYILAVTVLIEASHQKVKIMIVVLCAPEKLGVAYNLPNYPETLRGIEEWVH